MADGENSTPRRKQLTALEMARSDLLAYQVGLDKNYRPGLHHRVVAQVLMELEAGHLDRVMIEAPPRHGKTRQIGVDFPSFYLGRHPEQQIGYVTYNKERASDVGFFVRENFASGFHQRCFPAAKIDGRSKAATKFDLRKVRNGETSDAMAGGYRATGMGGSIVGRGFNGLIFDDTTKNRQEADSPTVQRRMREWFSGVAYNRLETTQEGRGGWMCSIMTRWGENDFHGYIQREYMADGWVVIRLPATGDAGDFLARGNGEPLWPERWSSSKLERIRKAMLPRDWMALYQQSPTDLEGLYFRKGWFNWYDVAPKNLNVYMTGDYGVKGEGGDFTCILVWGIDAKGDIWLLDGYWEQVTSDVWGLEEIKLVKAHNPRIVAAESGVIRHATEALLTDLRKRESVFMRRVWMAELT